MEVFKNLTLTVGSILIVLMLLEGGMRLFWSHPYFESIKLYEKHPYYGHRPIPGIRGWVATAEYEHLTTHSAQGLRGSQVFDAAKEYPRILLLGDSFTYGVGVATEETFAGKLSRAFPGVEVANTGAAAYDTRNEIAVMEGFGSAFRPDIILLFFFWNDLEGNLHNTFPRYGMHSDQSCYRLDSMRHWQEDPLALSKAGEAVSGNDGRWRLRFLFDEAVKGMRYSWWGIRKRSIRNAAQKQMAIDSTYHFLSIAQCLAQKIDTELVLVSIPDHNQVNPDARVKNISALNFEVQAPLERYCQEAGIRYFDLLPIMQSHFELYGKALYYRYDRHLNRTGHEVVGEALVRYIEQYLR